MLQHPSVHASDLSQPPAILVVDEDLAELERTMLDLGRRFGHDYRVAAASSAFEGLAMLDQLAADGTPVALVLAELQMTAMDGPTFLDAAHRLHRDARRLLLVTMSKRGINPRENGRQLLQSAISLGRADRWIAKGWVSPEEWFYPQIQSALTEWACSHLPRKEVVRVVGTLWDPATHQLRDILNRNVVPHGFYEADTPEAEGLLASVGASDASLPVAIFADRFFLANPRPVEVAAALETQTAPADRVYDLVILGAGPAGLAAAVYGASEGLDTLVVEPLALGGQAGMSASIRNYLGFPQGIPGNTLTARAYEQALLFGANFLFMQEAVALWWAEDHFHIRMSDCVPARARSVILAIGMRYRRRGIPDLDRLIGAGVYYGSASVEAPAMRGQDVFVIGGANSAAQAAIHLARFANKVTMLVRTDTLVSSMSHYLIEQIEATSNIEVKFQHQVVGAKGEHRLETLTIRSSVTGETQSVPTAGVFILIGAESCTEWLRGTVEMDEQGFIRTGRDVSLTDWPLERKPSAFETSLPGLFAVGDTRYRAVNRVASAVGEGSVAVGSVHRWIAELPSKT
ncbi:MAG: FAD-dependent oxidoreductase [Thermomicrobiales bacterium]